MKEDNIDFFLKNMFDLTLKLKDALKEEDLGETGRVIKLREDLIEKYEKDLENQSFNDNQKAMLDKINILDDEANRLAENFKTAIQNKMAASGRMKNGLISYIKTKHNLLSGQIVDKKR